MGDNKPLNVLITGGAGYVGRVLLNIAPSNWKLNVIDNVYGGNSDYSPNENVDFVKGDIRNNDLIEKLVLRNDVVIHLAGIVGDSCPKNLTISSQINVNATENLALLCKKHNRHLIFMSTCSVYGFNQEICTEQTKLNPVIEYGDHKVLGEKCIMNTMDDSLIFRMGSVYGWSPRMRFDLAINLFIEKSLWNEPIQVFGGEQWRPFIHVKDVANALIMAANSPEIKGILNLVTENHLIIELAKEITDNVVVLKHKIDNRSYKVDNTAIKQRLGWKPLMNIKNAISEFKKVDYKNKIYYNRQWDYS